MAADLHIHTNFSDGKDSLEKILRLLRKKTLRKKEVLIAITDHHFPTIQKSKIHKNIRVIPGIEISVFEHGYSFHLTGYSSSPNISPNFEKWLNNIRAGYQKRAARIRQKLIANGFKLPPLSKLRRRHLPLPVYTYDLAIALKKILKLKTEREVIVWAKDNGNLLWVEEKNFLPSPQEAIKMLSLAQYHVFWAHPGTQLLKDKNTTKIFEKFLKKFKECGLLGIEVFSPEHAKDQVLLLSQYAKKHALFVSGGSDYHGLGRGPKGPMFLLPTEFEKNFLSLLF